MVKYRSSTKVTGRIGYSFFSTEFNSWKYVWSGELYDDWQLLIPTKVHKLSNRYLNKGLTGYGPGVPPTWLSCLRSSYVHFSICTKMTNKMQLCRIIHYSLAALHVSSDIFAHHQEHLNCIYSFCYYSRMSLPAGRPDHEHSTTVTSIRR